MVDTFDKTNKWDMRFMTIAKEISEWSKDPSRKIGAVIVGKNKQIISQGYNGFPRGIEDKDSRLNDRQTKYQYIIHAEMNAIYNALYNGSSVQNSTIYVHGLSVCHECAKAICQVGISRVVMDTKPDERWSDSCRLALEIFNECGIKYSFLNYHK